MFAATSVKNHVPSDRPVSVMSPPDPTPRWKVLAGRVVFWLWVPALCYVVGSLMVGHWLPLPTPARDDPRLVGAVSARVNLEEPRWTRLHVLYAECPCSRRIYDALIERGSRPQIAETIVLVGRDEELERRAVERGYELDVLSPEQLRERYNVEAAPLFVIADPVGAVRYVGGYTDRKQGLAIKDEEILTGLMAGEEVETLPTFGCGVSQNLQAVLDPLNLKY